jgi:hypothetical protein
MMNQVFGVWDPNAQSSRDPLYRMKDMRPTNLMSIYLITSVEVETMPHEEYSLFRDMTIDMSANIIRGTNEQSASR